MFIAKYEWLLLKANRLLWLLTGITTVVVAFALYEGHERVSFQKATVAQIAEQEKADYAKYRAQIAAAKPGQHFDGGHFGDPTNPFYFGNRMGARYAALPPAPLAIVSSGQSDVYPYYYKITLSKKQALYHSEELENPQILFNGRFDLSFVIIFLLPLLIIGFTYNVYSAEKEAGTLTLLAAQNTSVQKIIRHRFLFRYLFFNLFFTALLVLGLLLFGVGIGALLDALPVAGITWLYTAFWFALSYGVNSLKKTSGAAATVLTGVWLALVLLIPTLISAVIDAVHPMPSKLHLITQTRAASDSIAKNKAVLSRFLEEHPEFKPVAADLKDRNPVTLRNRIEVETLVERLKAGYTAVAKKREGTVAAYRFLSPALFVQQALNKAAGTNDGRYKAFSQEVTAYQQRFRSYFEPLVYRQEKFTAADLDKVPAFLSGGATVTQMDKAVLIDVGFLALLTTAVLLAASVNWREGKKRRTASRAPAVARNKRASVEELSA